MKEEKVIVCYCRVSTVHQVDKESIPAQKHMLEKYVSAVFPNTPFEFFVDAGFSGKNEKRPQYAEMLRKIEQNEIKAVVTFKIDRVSRNLNDFLRFLDILKKHDVKFISLSENFDTSNVINQSILKMLALFGELERNMTSERVMSISKDIVARGGHLGQPTAYGYSYDKATRLYSINEKEAQWVKWMFKTAAEGKTTTYISNYLNDTGILTKRGGKWSSTTVNNILHNKSYTGSYVWNKFSSARMHKKDESEYLTNENLFPVIVSNALFEKVQTALKSRQRGQNLPRTKKTHLFSGIITCGDCGRKLQFRRDRPRKDKSVVTIYFCTGFTMHWGCANNKYISDVKIAPTIFQFLSNYIKLDYKRTGITTREELLEILMHNIKYELVNLDFIYQCYVYTHEENTSKYESEYQEKLAASSKASEEISKYNLALERLKDLYLYSDEGMTRLEYSKEREKILAKIKKVKKEADDAAGLLSTKLDVDKKKYKDILDYLTMANEVNYKYIRIHFSHDNLSEFMHDIFKEIIVYKLDILKITLKSGMQFNFK